MTLRVVFMGTPDFAVPTLLAVAARHEIVAVYTRAPSAAGRGLKARLSPVHQIAQREGWAVETPVRLRDGEAAGRFAAHGADVAVVVAYGLLLPKPILDAPPLGCLNLHASLLPRWRGAAPIQRAIMAGDRETGVAVMRMEEGLDTGPVGLTERVPIGPDQNAGDLHDGLATLGASLMARALDALETGSLGFAAQPEGGATYARKIDNQEARIDWSAPADRVHDHVRGLSPFPGAFMEVDLGRGPERVKVLRTAVAEGDGKPGTLLDPDGRVACGARAVRLLEVQRAGRGPMPAADFLRGVRLEAGAAFS
ncbi:MAG: methionyl-tRNA formyltransferase [Enterovirga sp.]|nr:methionyl-tRNA formyltransferase [Enterovirga sp.]